jgi:drug/metabolite transporter (DMT)-like permease
MDHTTLAILLALAASLCTATASVCQRFGAVSLHQGAERERAPAKRNASSGGFDPLLVMRLAQRPVWLLGFAGMLGGFACQVTALHFGPLALVQPILAVELLWVFGYLVMRDARAAPPAGVPRTGSPAGGPPGSGAPERRRRRRAAWRDWLAAATMSAGVAVFLAAASPSGGRPDAPAAAWWTAGISTVLLVSLVIATSRVNAASPAWRAACLGIATGISWGFVAAIIKELSARVTGGPAVIFTTWPAYALMATGAAAMLLTAHAMAAGPLAAAQPGFTIFDPVTAAILGVVLFGEQVRNTPLALTAEVLGLLALAIGARTLTRSTLLTPPAAPVSARPAGHEGQYHH